MKVVSPLTWGATGTMADITFTTWNGIKVGKGKIRHMTNPNTVNQQVTRKKRKIIGRVYEGLGSFLQVSVENKVTGQSKFSQVLKQVNQYVQVAPDLTVTAQYEQIPYSIGSLDTAAAGSAVSYENNNVKVTINPNQAQSASETDELYVVEFNKVTGRSKVYATGETRPISNPLIVNYPPQTSGSGQRYVYAVFISANQTKSSNTVNIGNYTIA